MEQSTFFGVVTGFVSGVGAYFITKWIIRKMKENEEKAKLRIKELLMGCSKNER